MATLRHNSRELIGEILKPRSSGKLQSLLAAPNLDWFNLLELSGNSLITPIIARKLDSPECVPMIPDEIREVLELIRERNRIRNKSLRDSFLRTANLLSKVDVYPLPLKGINLLLNDIYPDSADRIISDIDILVHPNELDRTLHLLQSEGYVQRCNPFLGNEDRRHTQFEALDPDDFRHRPSVQNHHLPPIKENINAEFCIEIHTRPCIGNNGIEAELNNLAFKARSYLREEPLRTEQPDLIFTLLHTAHHMLIQDKLLYLGVTDYRHLQDVDHLLIRIEKIGKNQSFLKVVENDHFCDLYTFLQWQCEALLGTRHTPNFTASEQGIQWVEDFKKVSARPIHHHVRQLLSNIKTLLPRLLTRQPLFHAFGDMPFKTAAPLYVMYQYKRAIAGIRYRSRPR